MLPGVLGCQVHGFRIEVHFWQSVPDRRERKATGVLLTFKAVFVFPAWFCQLAACWSRDVDLINEPTTQPAQRWSRDHRIHVMLAIFQSKADFKQEGNEKCD